MPEFDCYCFLCSGPLVACNVGSTSRGHLNRRRRRVERKLLAIEAGKSFDSFSSDSDHDSDFHSGDDDEVYVQDERRSYDPDLATAERIDWLLQVKVLGLNPRASGDTKSVSLLADTRAKKFTFSRAFISGQASYDDAVSPRSPTSAPY